MIAQNLMRGLTSSESGNLQGALAYRVLLAYCVMSVQVEVVLLIVHLLCLQQKAIRNGVILHDNRRALTLK